MSYQYRLSRRDRQFICEVGLVEEQPRHRAFQPLSGQRGAGPHTHPPIEVVSPARIADMGGNLTKHACETKFYRCSELEKTESGETKCGWYGDTLKPYGLRNYPRRCRECMQLGGR